MADDAAREIELDTGALRLAGRAWGDRGGAPVLALHGWLDNAASFDRLAPLLGGVQLVALDLPGHGRSEHRPAGSWYHFVDYVGDVLGAADALGWERFALLGHSLGERRRDLRGRRLPRARGPPRADRGAGAADRPARARPARLAEALQRAARAGRRPAPAYPDLEHAVAARRTAGDLSVAAARPLVARATVADADGLRWRSDPRLRLPSPHRFTEEQVLAMLGAMRAPTLAVGATEGLLPRDPAALERRAAAIPELRLEWLAGDHHLHLERPRPVAELLAPFLSRRDTGDD
ncbi:MAG: alpha/beta fold hydrolase [Halofilum sp. (in: g-proteobacteria)]|nr:alpha/beta fold hydrolase [Halofilum sp. (in: g-proteobacteria)]